MTEVKKRWEFVEDDTVEVRDHKLTRIRALIDDPLERFKAGDLGGYVEKEENLPHGAVGWVSGDAMVFEASCVVGGLVCVKAKVGGNARIFGNALVCGNACVGGSAQVSGDAQVYDKAKVGGNALIFGNMAVGGDEVFNGSARIAA